MTNPRYLRRAFLFALPLLLAFARPVAAELLADSTTTDAWRLANGLEVRVRHVPRASGVAITVGYRAGSAYEPAGREGVASLLAELAFTAPAGTIPERSRDEMASLRPLGWGSKVNDRLVVFTEITDSLRFAGVLHQVATRMRGVNPAPADLERSLATVRSELASRQFGRPELALYHRLRELALGSTDAEILRRASGVGLNGYTLKEANTALQRYYVPANACLAIAGDFGTLDVRALVEHEFGTVPAGVAQAEPAPRALHPFQRAAAFAGLDHTASAIGLFAPAIDDTLHPSFYLAMVVSGPFFTNRLGRPKPPLTSRFQYSLFDDAELVRFFLEPAPDETDPARIASQLSALVDQLSEQQMERDTFESVKRSVAWLVGGPLPVAVKDQLRRQPGALGTLANVMVSRALWKGDAFWDEYSLRLQRTNLSHNTFANWMTDPSHQGALLLLPKP